MDRPKSKIEHYEKRFGLIAIEKGFISPDQLVDALRIQVNEDIKHGTHRKTGEILLDLDIMNANQVEEVVKTMFSQSRLQSVRRRTKSRSASE